MTPTKATGDTPVAGFYKTALVRGGPMVPVCIWHGPPLDPIDGEPLDRSPRWQALACGRYIDLDRVWPYCGRNRIDLAEYNFLMATVHWAETNAPGDAFAKPRKPIDFNRMKPLF